MAAAKPKKAATRPKKAAARPKRAKADHGNSVLVDLTIDCTRCMWPLAIDALGEDVRCRACLAVTTLDATFFGSARNAIAKALSGGTERSTNFDEITVVSRSRRASPTCEGCGAGIALERAAPPAYSCECGRAIAVRAADDLLRRLHARASMVVGERRRMDLVPCERVAFRCACKAALFTDGTARAVACASCKRFVDVPEGLWRTLHPIEPRPKMFVLVGGAR